MQGRGTCAHRRDPKHLTELASEHPSQIRTPAGYSRGLPSPASTQQWSELSLPLFCQMIWGPWLLISKQSDSSSCRHHGAQVRYMTAQPQWDPRGDQPPCQDLNLSRPRRAQLLLQSIPHTSPTPFSSTHSPCHPPNPKGTGSMKGKWWEAPSLCPCLASLLLSAPAYVVYSKCQPEGSLYFSKTHSWSGLCPAHSWLTGSSL